VRAVRGLQDWMLNWGAQQGKCCDQYNLAPPAGVEPAPPAPEVNPVRPMRLTGEAKWP
jgi:hypothetical protein